MAEAVSHWLGILGGVLIVVVMADVLHTTLGQGGGFLGSRLTSFGWKVSLGLHRWRPSHRRLATSGVLVVVALIAFWLVGLWLAWTCVFSTSPEAVLYSETGRAASFAERFAFTGWVMVTLGTPAHLEAGHRLWDVMIPIAAANGFFMLTLAIAYLLPLVGAATETRRLATVISALGGNSTEILERTWDGEDCSRLDGHLESLVPEIALLAERHVTYPALHFLHSIERSGAIAPALAALDEALTILDLACTEEVCGDDLARGLLRRVITEELSTLRAIYVEPSDVPPPPKLDHLARLGFPLVERQIFERRLEEVAERRCLLHAFVTNDGWTWDDVCKGDPLPDEQAPEESEAGQPSGLGPGIG
jgi:hypothetical protein